MTAPESIATALDGQPGIAAAPAFRHGVWRIAVDAAQLPAVMGVVLNSLGMTLLLVAGEDRRRASGRMHAHYLCGRAASHELLHLDVSLTGDAPAVPTLAALSFPASRFEREMRDLLGITPIGHPDPRPLVRHGFWPDHFHPLREDAVLPDFGDRGQPFPFTPVQGDGVYEIPVGPVHAGVIEPGHFRFNVLGETILKMRARLYFTHKGTEKLFVGRWPDDGVALAERVSGDTSVGHAVAYCQAIESLADVEIPVQAAMGRVVLLELERIYNHVGDVGAILADTGFAVGQSHAMRLREALLRVNKRLTGHRFLRGIVVPGGLAAGIEAADLVPELRRIVADFDEVVAISLANTLVADRLEETGRLPVAVARDFGVVGYVARACGLAQDVRVDHPSPAYERLSTTAAMVETGDVKARMLVRVREIGQSLDLIERALAAAHSSPALRADVGPLPPFTMGFGIVEGWRGRLTHAVMAGEDGRLHRVKIVDPSFFNWPALARALEDNIVPDFPLCNKSFNQSYSGNDL
jgi:Ni,Fe-hydrogenase III large subunit/Ni,Fe-hydrogenase III component G